MGPGAALSAPQRRGGTVAARSGLSFPRSAWERTAVTLCVTPPPEDQSHSCCWPGDAERRGLAFPRGAWEREPIFRWNRCRPVSSLGDSDAVPSPRTTTSSVDRWSILPEIPCWGEAAHANVCAVDGRGRCPVCPD